ncbi:MAG TPA: lysylphosphatidylglycerol synthase transmembrane domain-containing protein [Bacteroidales bacterium]|nr:lysylphosphatidylglycerol synthase transmembrane domain-containing protein [Bacteroidales bacterium]
MNKTTDHDLIRKLKPGKIFLPVIIGVGVVAWLVSRELNIASLKEVDFNWKSAFWILVAFMLIFARTFSYMARIKGLTDNKITWIQSFRIIMLWEFTSAITPSTVGGTAFAVIFVHKEGINTGKSTSVVLLTSFLDELYFVIMFPVVLLIAGGKSIFVTAGDKIGSLLINNLYLVAILGYVIILAWVLVVGYGLFFRPEAIRSFILRIFRLPFLKRWSESAIKAGDDIVSSSRELKNKNFRFWWNAGLHTFIPWTARYLVVNAILTAFFSIDHLVVFSRQLVLWIIMIVSPTPGGSGISEILLGSYISDQLNVGAEHVVSLSLAVAVIWRLITYYPFLIAGAFIIPVWIKRNFSGHPTGK